MFVGSLPNGSLYVAGADEIVKHPEQKLNIRVGETTADGMFTLKTVECLGSCGTAPMLQCGAAYYENLTADKTDALLEQLRVTGKRSSYLSPINDNSMGKKFLPNMSTSPVLLL